MVSVKFIEMLKRIIQYLGQEDIKPDLLMKKFDKNKKKDIRKMKLIFLLNKIYTSMIVML